MKKLLWMLALGVLFGTIAVVVATKCRPQARRPQDKGHHQGESLREEVGETLDEAIEGAAGDVAGASVDGEQAIQDSSTA